MATVRLFVYGTLKRGYCRSHVLDGQRFLGEAVTLPHYRLYNCGEYPALVPEKSGLPIEGELWEIDAPCLQTLDAIEGIDSGLYERRLVKLQPPYQHDEVLSYFYLPGITGFRDCGLRWP